MNSRLVCLFSVLIIAASSLLVIVDGCDADWVDSGYREPPEADHVIHLTDDLPFASNDPEYTVCWTISDVSGTDGSDAVRFMTLYVASANEGVSGYSYNADSCLPSWITWDSYFGDKGHMSPDYSTFEITIRPALQQVTENTVGHYWIWFECTCPDFLSTETSSYLIDFTVYVDWNGGVIVPENYSEFILRLDYGIDGGSNNKTMRIISGIDAQEVRFVVKDLGIVREGYTFKGWSQTSGSSSTDVGDEFPVNVNMSNVRTTVDDDGNKIHSITLYAVWEKDPEEELDLPDFFSDALDLLNDPAVLVIFFIIVFGVAFIVRSRRVGGL